MASVFVDLMPGNRAHRPSLQGSVFWMAPEVVKQTAYTRKADIWSIGCLVVEMLTGEHPWAQLTQMQAIFKVRSSSSCHLLSRSPRTCDADAVVVLMIRSGPQRSRLFPRISRQSARISCRELSSWIMKLDRVLQSC